MAGVECRTQRIGRPGCEREKAIRANDREREQRDERLVSRWLSLEIRSLEQHRGASGRIGAHRGASGRIGAQADLMTSVQYLDRKIKGQRPKGATDADGESILLSAGSGPVPCRVALGSFLCGVSSGHRRPGRVQMRRCWHGLCVTVGPAGRPSLRSGTTRPADPRRGSQRTG